MGDQKLSQKPLAGTLTGTEVVYAVQNGVSVQLPVSSIVTPAPTYSNATPTAGVFGGIAAGSTFVAKTIAQMFDALLYPYQNPAFSSFTYTGYVATVEVGTTLSGSKTFTWGTTNSGNITANTIQIRDVTNAVNLATGLGNTGSSVQNIGSVVKNTATTHQWSVTGTNTNAVTFSSTLTVTWRWKVYSGESALTALTEVDIEALRVGNLQTGFGAVYTMLGGGYKYICYPSTLGTATTFKDGGNQNVAMEAPYTVSVTNVNGVTTNYNVHRTTNTLAGAVTITAS
jgi:hypothetical protein